MWSLTHFRIAEEIKVCAGECSISRGSQLCDFGLNNSPEYETFGCFLYISDQRQVYHPLTASIFIVLADFLAWCLILMLKVSGIEQNNKNHRILCTQMFFQDKKIITIYKKNKPHINITDKICSSIWKPSRPGLCKLFRNQHKHLSHVWFWEMKLQNKQNFYVCVCRRNVCPGLLCWGLMRSHHQLLQWEIPKCVLPSIEKTWVK